MADPSGKRGQLKEAHYPCPACGAPLYGWTAAHNPLERGHKTVIDRCESCGLAVTRAEAPPDPDAEIEPLLETGPGGIVKLRAPNRRSIQGSIGGAQWAGLEPEIRRLHLTPRSAELLLERRGLEVRHLSTPFCSDGRRGMLQTFLNAFTLRDNFLRNARAGRIAPASARERWLHRLDYVVSYLVIVPSAIFALPLEALGAALGRGGVMEIEAAARTPG
jgi:hypothetical protein